MPPTPSFIPPQRPFVPSPRQRRLLTYIDEHPGFKTVQELCAAAGIGRTTYYRWSQDPDFRLWLATAWSARLIMDGTVLINVARLQCTRKYAYWKALFDLTFNPSGLGLLQHWQTAVALADPDAGALARWGATPGPAPVNVPPPPEPNQSFSPQNGTKSTLPNSAQPSEQGTAYHPPRPHHAAGCIRRALGGRLDFASRATTTMPPPRKCYKSQRFRGARLDTSRPENV